MYPERQEFLHEPRGKGLDDSQTAAAVGLKDQGKLYLKVSPYSFHVQFFHSTIFRC